MDLECLKSCRWLRVVVVVIVEEWEGRQDDWIVIDGSRRIESSPPAAASFPRSMHARTHAARETRATVADESINFKQMNPSLQATFYEISTRKSSGPRTLVCTTVLCSPPLESLRSEVSTSAALIVVPGGATTASMAPPSRHFR